MRFVAALCAAALTVGLGACGDDGASAQERDEDQIEALAARFERILAADDTEAFCGVLAPNDVNRLGAGESDGEEECLTVWAPPRNPLFQARNPDLEIEDLSFRGGIYATATLANGGELSFAKEKDRWYVHLSPEGSAKG